MMTLAEKKKHLFNYMRKPFACTERQAFWLKDLNIFKFASSPEYSTKHWKGLCIGLEGNCYNKLCGSSEGIFRLFKEVQKEIQKTLLKDTYIKVNNEQESRWVQELLFSVGFSWNHADKPSFLDAKYIHIDAERPLGYSHEGISYGAYKINISWLETLFQKNYIGKKRCFNHVVLSINEYKYLKEQLKNKTQVLEETERLLADANSNLSHTRHQLEATHCQYDQLSRKIRKFKEAFNAL